jgi:hypothetical protein
MTIHKPNLWDGVYRFVARSDDEFRAYIEAEIASARCGPAPVRLEPGDDDDGLVAVESAPQPAAPPSPANGPRRQRKRSLTKVCEAARKAGADRVIVDGVVIVLSPSAAVPESNANEWDAVLPEADHGPH